MDRAWPSLMYAGPENVRICWDRAGAVRASRATASRVNVQSRHPPWSERNWKLRSALWTGSSSQVSVCLHPTSSLTEVEQIL